MEDIMFMRYGPDSGRELEDKLICCYQSVFAGKPWFESWSYEQVKKDLRHEITDECSCWLAMRDEEIVGFCWGYPISLAELETKLGIELDTSLLGPIGSRIAYQDELGVLEALQGRKIAKALFRLRNDDFLSQGLATGIVRTRKSPVPSVTFDWYTQKLGYAEIAQYPSEHGGVVLTAALKTTKMLTESN